MTKAPRPTPARRSERAVRDARLAEALRANLHRRKEQARARECEPSASQRPSKAAGDEEPVA